MRKDIPRAEFYPNNGLATFRLLVMQMVCLSAVGLIAIGSLTASIPALVAYGFRAEWIGMTLDPVIAAVGCAASLAFTMARRSRTNDAASRILALAAAVPAFLELISRFGGRASALESLIHAERYPVLAATMPTFVAVAFVLLAVELCLIRLSRGIASYAADCILFVLALLCLALGTNWVFSLSGIFNTASADATSPAAICTLGLLTVVTFSVRAQYGAFDVLVDAGTGSRIARALTPLMLILPFVREAGRARIKALHLLPEHSQAAILASAAAMVSFGLLILIARHIRRMEGKINQLSLRDELTGLYNLRGFRLLAEQGLRFAYRSQSPFSVMFVDLDGLKEINDSLGHTVGSALLVATAGLLTDCCRETDVIARIGGDEFAIAGQFSQTGILIAAQRLEDQASTTRVEASGGRPLSFSIGYATSGDQGRRSLQDLLDEADSQMYDRKRQKRVMGGETSQVR